jgi:hypothetical protein
MSESRKCMNNHPKSCGCPACIVAHIKEVDTMINSMMKSNIGPPPGELGRNGYEKPSNVIYVDFVNKKVVS